MQPLNRTKAFWDRETRNEININWDIIEENLSGSGNISNEALIKANEALIKSNDAEIKSDSAKNTAETVQQSLNNIILENGNSEPEVVQARGNYDVLNTRLTQKENEFSGQLSEKAQQIQQLQITKAPLSEVERLDIEKAAKNEVNALATNKADRTYVDGLLSGISDASPRDVFYSIAALNATFPNGEVGTYLVYDSSFTDGAHAFIWSASENIWKDLGVYQAVNVGDRSITQKQLAFLAVQGVRGKNLFDKNSVVTGKYVRYSDGAIISLASYSYYIMPCLPNTEYAKKYSYQFCYLDANQQFISGVQAEYRFTTPSNCYFVAINCENATLDTMQVELGSNITDYEPFKVLVPKENVQGIKEYVTNVVVAKDGTGDFTTITAALNSTTNNIHIKIMPGVYLEQLKIYASDRKVSIVGTDPNNCIIQDNSGDYYKAPLDCSGNIYVENIKFVATETDGTPYSLPAYAVHIDHLGGAGTTHFKNCTMISYVNAAVGIGLRQDQTVILENCTLRKNAERETGSLYAHNAQASNVTNQHLIVKNCYITTSHGFAAKIDDANTYNGGTNSPMDMLFLNNTFYSDTKGKTNLIWFRDAPINGGVSGQIKLKPESFGNNVSVLNPV